MSERDHCVLMPIAAILAAMEALRTLRLRLAMFVIAALLLQVFAPSLHARAAKFGGDGLPWSDLCTSSGQTAGLALPTGGDPAVPGEYVRMPLSGDNHCPSCLVSFSGAPAIVARVRVLALYAPEGWASEHRAPDRTSTWSAQQTRGPPAIS
jgi:hypothetical protein